MLPILAVALGVATISGNPSKLKSSTKATGKISKKAGTELLGKDVFTVSKGRHLTRAFVSKHI